MIFFVIGIILGSLAFYVAHDVNSLECGYSKELEPYRTLTTYGYQTLCSRECVCYIKEDRLAWFDY